MTNETYNVLKENGDQKFCSNCFHSFLETVPPRRDTLTSVEEKLLKCGMWYIDDDYKYVDECL